MRKSYLMLIPILLLIIVQAQAANGRIDRIRVISPCPIQTVTSSGQTVSLSPACLNAYSLSVSHTDAGTTPHTYRIVWAGESRGPATTSNSYYQFSNLSGPATYTVYIDEAAGGEVWTVTVAAATPSATITVLSPNGGEAWVGGSTAMINWTSSGLSPSSYVKIYMNRAYPFGAWETISSLTPNDGTHAFTLNVAATRAARICVISNADPTVGDTSNGNFRIVVPSITVTTPNGGESVALGSAYDITWSSSELSGENVKIELKRSYPAGAWETLAESTPNTGGWSWIPTGAVAPAARVRISGTVHTAVADTSDASFTITSGGTAPTITVVLPNGGEYWPIGSTQTIRWTSTNFAEDVKIEIDRAFGANTWEPIVDATPNDGVYAWTITGSISATARVRVSGVVTPSVTDHSDAMFTVSGGGGAINILSPNGGDHWVIGTTRSVTWSAPTLNGNVRIEINRQYPHGAWTTIISSTSNDGSHTFMVTPSATIGARIRVSSVNTPSIHDISDGSFTIASSMTQRGQDNVDGLNTPDTPLPTTAYLAPNFPNPFNPSTTLEFGVPEAAHVTLKVFDVTGREVTTLLAGDVAAGQHRVQWNCADCPAGLYLVVLSGPNFHVVQKATFLK